MTWLSRSSSPQLICSLSGALASRRPVAFALPATEEHPELALKLSESVLAFANLLTQRFQGLFAVRDIAGLAALQCILENG